MAWWKCIYGMCVAPPGPSSNLYCRKHDPKIVHPPAAPMPPPNRRLTRKLDPGPVRTLPKPPRPPPKPVYEQPPIDDFCALPSCREPVAARTVEGGSGIFCTEHSGED